MRRSIWVSSALLPALLPLTGCCAETRLTYPSESEVVSVPSGEFLAALDDQGGIDPAQCEALCRSRVQTPDLQSVDGCAPAQAFTEPTVSPTTTTTGGSGIGGSGGESPGPVGVQVTCNITAEREVCADK